jgi:twinfilin
LTEALVIDATVPPLSTLANDLNRLQSLLDDNVPAYVLARLDDPPSAWLAVHYVPDTASVRDKVPTNDVPVSHAPHSPSDALRLDA